MDAKNLTLNIAVNMGRLCRWVMEGKNARVDQFLKETESYLNSLENTAKSEKFMPTFTAFKSKFFELKNREKKDKVWAEEALTWANILQHRAKLA